MDLLKCPRCGELYSASYRRCPFCEEEAGKGKRARGNRSGRRGYEKKRTHSARGPMVVILLFVVMVLTWCLFGEQIRERIVPDVPEDPAVEDPDVSTPEDPGTDEPDEPDAPDAPEVPDDPGADEPDEPGADEPVTPVNPITPDTVDKSSLSLMSTYGAVSKGKEADYDLTIGLNDYIQLSVKGTDEPVTWSSSNESVLTVAENGQLVKASRGLATVTAHVAAGVDLTCIVRVK